MSFTGSPAVGWDLKARAGKKKVTLELGGNAACIVDSDADIEDAISRIIFGAFYQSGQSCIGVQRILIQRSIYDTFKYKLVAVARALKMGDPKDETVFIGPLISEKEAIRLESWINRAKENGARLLCGGHRKGNLLSATLLENVPTGESIWSQEAFGPVAVLDSFDHFDETLAKGASRKAATKLALSLLKEFNLSEFAGQLAGTLSYGDKRKVEIVRALAGEPHFLLLDEPVAGMNEAESETLLKILAELPGRKKLGMLIIDHDMTLIMHLCHRLHVLSSGKTIGEGDFDYVRKLPAVIEAYLGTSDSTEVEHA